jgi:hypothetical protein
VNVADDGEDVVIHCEVLFRHRRGKPAPILRARRWFKCSLRGYDGEMRWARRVDPGAVPPPDNVDQERVSHDRSS